MHRGLPLVTSIKLVSFSSSESGFETSVDSATLIWASEISRLVTSDIISICNTIVEISEVLEYSFPSLKSGFSIKLKSKNNQFTFYLLGTHL